MNTKSTMLHAVSYYVESEGYWQFAGEWSDVREAEERASYLHRQGHKVRITSK